MVSVLYICIHGRTQYSVDPPPLSYTSSESISNIFTFLESLGQMNLCGRPFFENERPHLGQKSKNVPNCGVVALFRRVYCNAYTEEVWNCRGWRFFRFWKYWKLNLLWSKKQNPVFLSFGVSSITLLLINLLINVTYFWNRLLNSHLLTYRTVPSSILDFCLLGTQKVKKKVENLYIFYIYLKLTYLYVKFVKLNGRYLTLMCFFLEHPCV